jgi:hypothetical protein
VVGERTDPEIDARQIEALLGTQFTADRDFALDIVGRYALDDQLNQAVVEREPVARLHDMGQSIEARRDPLQVADDVLAGQREVLARKQLDRLRFDFADTHLGTRQVGHDDDVPSGGLFCRADARDALGVAVEVPVREVEPRDIQPRANEAFEHLRRFRGRSDRGDDLGLVVGQWHGAMSDVKFQIT